MTDFKRRHDGARWVLAYGAESGPERIAVLELQRELQRHLPYVLEVTPAARLDPAHDGHLALIGTPASNPLLAPHLGRMLPPVPTSAEGYSLAVGAQPDRAGRLVIVAGHDGKGVLNGVADLCARLGRTPSFAEFPAGSRLALDNAEVPPAAEAPKIGNRGIWSWGYVIYDYRRFLDRMARLRLNMLTIWNDAVPCNIEAICDYAHARGIRILLGFAWGWGDCGRLDIRKPAEAARLSDEVVGRWQREYAELPIDGIYFQTQTEHQEAVGRDGRSMARVACEFVHATSARILEIKPDLLIQFGLHATSIQDHVGDLAGLDPRVVIVWEDAGVIPWSYDAGLTRPSPPGASAGFPCDFESTLAYSAKLAALRPACREFAMVPKGWSALSWKHEFENHRDFVLGERDADWIAERARVRAPAVMAQDAVWLVRYPYLLRFYREALAWDMKTLTVTGLVEDAVLEERLPLGVRLLAETLWNPCRPGEDVLQAAASPWHDRPLA